ncbi:unnamed protein product [Arabidopsis thaliana]|uniref:NYN domain-containing protein n=1 Tax=Arabidopsis thaliana TaxID=3702 RepID=A0A5S9VU62_ARATH|nr:unnamed protein product [Arabidopsis thaliana]
MDIIFLESQSNKLLPQLVSLWATQLDKDDVAVTTVFWDINRCPVPLDCDPCRVGPAFRQYLEDLRYSGPLTIYAIGRLTDISDDILQAMKPYIRSDEDEEDEDTNEEDEE